MNIPISISSFVETELELDSHIRSTRGNAHMYTEEKNMRFEKISFPGIVKINNLNIASEARSTLRKITYQQSRTDFLLRRNGHGRWRNRRIASWARKSCIALAEIRSAGLIEALASVETSSSDAARDLRFAMATRVPRSGAVARVARSAARVIGAGGAVLTGVLAACGGLDGARGAGEAGGAQTQRGGEAEAAVLAVGGGTRGGRSVQVRQGSPVVACKERIGL